MNKIGALARNLVWAMEHEKRCLDDLAKAYPPWKLWRTKSFYEKQEAANNRFVDAIASRERAERELEDAIESKIREAIFADRRDKYI